MARLKIDGVIESVRYGAGGKIILVRSYQRRGAVWSDHILLGRPELVEQLKNGKRFVIGARKKDLGSVFETGAPVRFVDDHIFTEGQSTAREFLAGVPVF